MTLSFINKLTAVLFVLDCPTQLFQLICSHYERDRALILGKLPKIFIVAGDYEEGISGLRLILSLRRSVSSKDISVSS